MVALTQTQKIFAYLHKTESSGNLHLRVRQPPGAYNDALKDALHRIGSPARWNQELWEWDYPLTVAAVVGLQRVAEEYHLDIEYSPDLEQFATEQKKLEDYEKSVRLAIEKIIRDGDVMPQYITNTVNGTKAPMRHQQVAFHWGLRVSGLLLAHQPGLGKTRSGIDISRGWYDTSLIRPMQQVWLPQQNRWGVRGGVLVVCPNQMQRTWRDEFVLWQNMTALEITGERKKKLLVAGTAGHAHVINYESLKIVEGNQYDGLIVDECFVAGTPVHTERGVRAIEEVKTGERVWAFDHETNETVLRDVTHTFANPLKGRLCLVTTEKGSFTCTEGHPFYTERGYVAASLLEAWDKVLSRKGVWLRVIAVTVSKCVYGPVFNLEVKQNNNYFVGEVPHLVHNCHRCANHSQQTTRVLELAQFARRKLALTGTPVANSLESVFYQMLIVDGGRSLGSSKTAYLEKWFTSETVGPGVVEQVPKQGAVDDVSRAMARCTYFLKKEEALDLPPKIHTPIKIPMTDDQERYYTSLKNDTITYIQDASVTVEQAASRMMKLRQVCQGFLLDDEQVPRDFNASKVEMLMDMITGTLAGRKVVVWGVFTHEINRLCSLLHQKNIGYVRLDGTVNSKKQRDEAMSHWNTNPAVTVFVGQIQMGVGITLHANECHIPCYDCIYLGIDYSYINWVQSQDRIHRIGQKYACNYTYLLTEGGIDATIYKALLTKASTANQVHKTGKEFFRSLLIGDIPNLAALGEAA